MDHILKHPLDEGLVDEPGTSTGPWAKYLIMTSSDGGKTLNTLSPSAIHKGVNGISGGDVTIKRQFNGDIYLTICWLRNYYWLHTNTDWAGGCCVCGIGSMTNFLHMFAMLSDEKMRSGL